MDTSRNSGTSEDWEIPRLFPDSIICVLGSGPSFNQRQAELVRASALRATLRVISVCNTYQLYPWADVHYACDAKWWRRYTEAMKLPGLKISLQRTEFPIVKNVRQSGDEGLDFNPAFVRTGSNSGHQAINIAMHLGARKIILVGFDMQRTDGKSHWHGDHPKGLANPSDDQFVRWQKYAATIPPYLSAVNVEIVNCSRSTALTCFRRAELEQELP